MSGKVAERSRRKQSDAEKKEENSLAGFKPRDNEDAALFNTEEKKKKDHYVHAQGETSLPTEHFSILPLDGPSMYGSMNFFFPNEYEVETSKQTQEEKRYGESSRTACACRAHATCMRMQNCKVQVNMHKQEKKEQKKKKAAEKLFLDR